MRDERNGQFNRPKRSARGASGRADGGLPPTAGGAPRGNGAGEGKRFGGAPAPRHGAVRPRGLGAQKRPGAASAAPKRAKSAREVALEQLMRWERDGEWSAAAFSAAIRAAALERRDAALATFLANGVVQNRILLDHLLGKLSKIPLDRLERRVLNALRLGVFQLFLSDVPTHAALDSTVSLVERRSAGFVNAVLRAATRLDGDPLAVDEADPIKRLSIKYSHPKWIVRELVKLRGEALAEAELRANNSAPKVTLHTNTARLTRDELIEKLRAEGVDAEPGLIAESVDISGSGDISKLKSYLDGDFWVQDVSSQLAVAALGIEPGMRVLDLCCAPGGKTFAAAALGARVSANDISDAKMREVAAGAQRLGFELEMTSGDARELREEWLGAFDRVICDLPCSGLGIIRKKPDIRYKTAAEVDGLPVLQREILAAAAKCVKKGGKLLYSTCTWRIQENDRVVEDFLGKNPGFYPIDFVLPNDLGESEAGKLTLWSEKGDRDGFFICVLGEKDV